MHNLRKTWKKCWTAPLNHFEVALKHLTINRRGMFDTYQCHGIFVSRRGRLCVSIVHRAVVKRAWHLLAQVKRFILLRGSGEPRWKLRSWTGCRQQPLPGGGNGGRREGRREEVTENGGVGRSVSDSERCWTVEMRCEDASALWRSIRDEVVMRLMWCHRGRSSISSSQSTA